MRDVELYRTLLGLTAPWPVAGVDVDMEGRLVVVWVRCGAGAVPVSGVRDADGAV